MEPQSHIAHRSQRFILHQHDTPAAVFDAAQENEWRKLGETTHKGFRKKALHIAWEMSPGVRISYLSDRKTRTSYLVITSKETSNLDPYAVQLADTGLVFLTPEELINEVTAARTPKERGLALVRSGIGAPKKPTKSYVHTFFEAMRDPEPSVRMSGITAIGYAEWPKFQELLVAVAEQDDDRQVREHARSMAAAFRKAE